ncbi:hypothetical protein Tco_0211457 [Tanacetum coccineum]
MPRNSFNTLADNLHNVMVETLPTMVDKHIKEQVMKQVPEQVRNQVLVYVMKGLILERQKAKEEMERLIAKDILQESGNIQAQISTQIENAIANIIPSQVDASICSYMSGHILHVHPTQSQTSSVPDQQYQLYLAMKANPQLQQQDIAIWLALQMKFKRNTVLQTACRTLAVRPRDQDDPVRINVFLTFGGNDESKKMQKYILKQQFEGFTVSNSDGIHKGYERFQSLLSQLEIHGAGVSTEDANQKFLRSLPSAWLYSSSFNLQIVAFCSEKHQQYNVSIKLSSLDHEDLDLVDEYDLRNRGLKNGKVAMDFMRIKKFLQEDWHFASELLEQRKIKEGCDGWNPGNKDGAELGKKEGV